MKTLLFSLLISSLLSLSLSELCNPNDKKVLLHMKQHFGNPDLLASWKPETDCCTNWNRVYCDNTTGRVISLTISNGDLSGTIPAAVGFLPYLQWLDFYNLSNVTGPIPPTISKLRNLSYLSLCWLNITGPIPNSLGQLKNLEYLNLYSNSLSGAIPSSLASLRNINVIQLHGNKLTGPIPESFGRFQGKVPDLHLYNNQLSGKIPTSLGNMNFNLIDFSQNRLQGDASMLFGPNKTTQFVYLSRNKLEFDLSKVVFPTSLITLAIDHNKIFGSIPAQITQTNLLSLNVSYNRLCGQIPVGQNMQSFDYSAYSNNRCLCGAPLASCK